jgi:hypothetical protein
MRFAITVRHLRTSNILCRTLLTLSLVMIVHCAQSQSTVSAQIAAISGTVMDVTGAVIPKARVTLQAVKRPTVGTTTDGVGHFALEAEPGDYTLQASASGFALYNKTVHLLPATESTEQIRLTIGGTDGCGTLCVTIEPPITLLNASLDQLLPLNPLPPFHLSARTLKHLQR